MVKLTNEARPATFEVEAYNERGEMVPTAIAGAASSTAVPPPPQRPAAPGTEGDPVPAGAPPG